MSIRWRIADFLSFLACKLRGFKWYNGWSYPEVYGNRAAELKENIRFAALILADMQDESDADQFERINRCLDELAQMAGENWGRIKGDSK